MDIKKWIATHPTDIKKIRGEIPLSKLDYKILLKELKKLNYTELILELKNRQSEVYPNYDAFISPDMIPSQLSYSEWKAAHPKYVAKIQGRRSMTRREFLEIYEELSKMNYISLRDKLEQQWPDNISDI